jgi:hypothetical protein
MPTTVKKVDSPRESLSGSGRRSSTRGARAPCSAGEPNAELQGLAGRGAGGFGATSSSDRAPLTIKASAWRAGPAFAPAIRRMSWLS